MTLYQYLEAANIILGGRGKMATRLATHSDTQELVKFLAKYHAEDSNLKDIPFSKQSMSKAIGYYIGMPKHAVFVYETEDKVITGVLMGSI